MANNKDEENLEEESESLNEEKDDSQEELTAEEKLA